MDTIANPDLRNLNSLKVEASAKVLVKIDDGSQIPQAVKDVSDLPRLTLGGGSNILFVDDFPGAVLQVANRGIEIVSDSGAETVIRVAAGEVWHDLVCWACQRQLWGLENLALIPGTVGAAPIQNIGAYGVELSQSLGMVEVFDLSDRCWRTMDNNACQLEYRNSIFRRNPDRFIVRAVHLRLSRQPNPVLNYPDLQSRFSDTDADQLSAADIARAVTEIRQRKLPDPGVIPNAGSFFKNPVISREHSQQLPQETPRYPAGEQVKISAAWLIQACGFKGHKIDDAGVYDQHALVLVNHGTATGRSLWALAGRIMDKVEHEFGIRLEPEPRIIQAPDFRRR